MFDFPVLKVIESRSGRASTSGVDIFLRFFPAGIRAEARMPRARRSPRGVRRARFPPLPPAPPDEDLVDPTLRLLDFSVTVMKRLRTELFLSLGCLWRNWKADFSCFPYFILFFFDPLPAPTSPPPLLSCSSFLFKLSVYVKDSAETSSIDLPSG